MNIRSFLVLISFVALFTACHKDHEDDGPDNRTILVYMMADNSLTGFSASDINEMVAGMASVDVSKNNLLLYVDTKSGTPQLIKLDKSKGKIVQTVIKTYDEQTSTDETVMKSVFSTVFNAYPATSYGLVLWSHGEGWVTASANKFKKITTRWIGQDTNGGTSYHYLNISTLASVLSTAPHFDFILMDACFMSSVEALYDLRSYTDYFVGSPTEIPGPGAYYTDVVPAMFATSNEAQVVTNAYYNYYNKLFAGGVNGSNDNWTFGVSVALVKSSMLADLAAATKSVVPRYIQNGAEVDVSNIFCYDPYRQKYYYDLEGLIKTITNGNADYTAWKQVYDQCVITYLTTASNFMSYSSGSYDSARSMTGSTGLSAYIPSSTGLVNGQFKQTAWYTDAGWGSTGW
jgi:hypothetical protein